MDRNAAGFELVTAGDGRESDAMRDGLMVIALIRVLVFLVVVGWSLAVAAVWWGGLPARRERYARALRELEAAGKRLAVMEDSRDWWRDTANQRQRDAETAITAEIEVTERWKKQADFHRSRFRRALFMAHDARARTVKVQEDARRILTQAVRDREVANLCRQLAATYAQLLRECPIARNTPNRAEREWRERVDRLIGTPTVAGRLPENPNGNAITPISSGHPAGHEPGRPEPINHARPVYEP